MKEIEKLNHDDFTYVIERDPKTWSLALIRFHHASCEFMDNGFQRALTMTYWMLGRNLSLAYWSTFVYMLCKGW